MVPIFVVLSALALCALLLAVVKPEPMPAAQLTVAPPSATETVLNSTVAGSTVALVRYVESDRTLIVSEHAPRDLLVCLRGDCRLVEEWLGK